MNQQGKLYGEIREVQGYEMQILGRLEGGNVEFDDEEAETVGQDGLMGDAADEKDQKKDDSRDKDGEAQRGNNDENAGFGRDESSK